MEEKKNSIVFVAELEATKIGEVNGDLQRDGCVEVAQHLQRFRWIV